MQTLNLDKRIMKVRAKNISLKKGHLPNRSTFYRTALTFNDGKHEYPLYRRGAMRMWNDIPLGEYDLGVIFNGYFCLIIKGNEFTNTTLTQLRDLEEQVKDRQITVLDNVKLMIASNQN